MSTMPILLADLKEIMTAIVPLVMLVFWIISQVFGQKGAQPKQGKPVGNPRPQADEGGLKAEIERFLQEAKQQQQPQQKPIADRELNTESEQQREEQERQERQRRKQERKRRQQEQEREAARERAREIANQSTHRHEEIEIIEDAQDIGSYPEAPREISPYLKNPNFIESASHLGEQVGQTDERLESHLHDVFDHQVGNFADSPDASIAREAARKGDLVTIKEITDMLRTPSNFRQAIIMKEILDRPESRWS